MAISGCTVTIPNTRVCSVAGVMAAGAICANTLNDQTEDLNLQQFLEFLEPQVDRGPALCLSTDDFTKLQIAMEQACSKLGTKCTKEQQEEMKKMSYRMDRLRSRRKG